MRLIVSGFLVFDNPSSKIHCVVTQYLAIVNTKNSDLSVYCISGKPQGLGRVAPPVWSPDGQQLLVESPLPDEHSEVLLLDLNRNVIATVGKDMTPVGWMVEP
jgi:Tol biopolymer transport system component